MSDAEHKYFAVEYNKRFWQYYTKAQLTEADKIEMLNAAYASLVHWKDYSGGTVLNQQRGEYLIAKAWMHLGDTVNALRYSARCLEMTHSHADLMKDFDVALAYELRAKAERMAGNTVEADRLFEIAREKGQAIADKEDRDIFFEDIEREI